jgi:hypothetical protein
MDKIYLKLKQSISLTLQEDTWAFHENDLLIIEKVGEKVTITNDGYGKTNRHISEVWRLNEIRYNKLTCIKDMTYELTILNPNLIGAKFQGSNTLWTELSSDMRVDTRGMIFDDVSVEYIRDEKIKKLSALLSENKINKDDELINKILDI